MNVSNGIPILPAIKADPYDGSHTLRWSRTARSLPDTRYSLSREVTSFLEDDDTEDYLVPYRLPRISVSQGEPIHGYLDEDKMFSRYGYQENVRIPQLCPMVRMINPPQTIAQTQRQANLAVPKFYSAAINPTKPPSSLFSRERSNLDDAQSLRKKMTRFQDEEALLSYQEMHNLTTRSKIKAEGLEREPTATHPDPSPSPVSRLDSPAKSVRSIHWMLGSTRHPSFDYKGRTRCQGPFSREFTVTCIAPSNWMKMKWGRSKTMVH